MPHQVATAHGFFWCWQDSVRQALMTGQFWDQQIQPAIDSADMSGTAIDLGANIGWFTVYMAKRFHDVIAFEAHPSTFELLERNLLDNGVSANVWAIMAAAYSRVTPLRLATAEMVGWPIADEIDLDQVIHPASLAFVPETLRQEGLRVLGVPVDRYIPNDTRVTLIKTDVQGCDLHALRGCVETIRRCKPVIIFEYEMGASQWHGDTWQDYLDFFAGLSYTVERIREDLWDYVARPA